MAVNPTINALKKRPMPTRRHAQRSVMNVYAKIIRTDDCSRDTHIQSRMGIGWRKKGRTDTVTSSLGQSWLRHLSSREEGGEKRRR
jgi:hypothetical protein